MWTNLLTTFVKYWKVLTSVEIQIKPVPVTSNYQFKVEVHQSTGLIVSSTKDGACNYQNTQDTSTGWFPTTTSESGTFYLVRCELGSGHKHQSKIKIYSRHKDTGDSIDNNFASPVIPKAPHLHNKTANYRLCGQTPPTNTPVDYPEAIKTGAEVWNDVAHQTANFTTSKLAVTHSNCYHTHLAPVPANSGKDILSISSHPIIHSQQACNLDRALACVKLQTKDVEKDSHLGHQTMLYAFPLPDGEEWTDNILLATAGRYYLPTVIAHEFGHAGGLGHTPNRNHLLYHEYNPSNPSQASAPTNYDKEAMKKIYENHN